MELPILPIFEAFCMTCGTTEKQCLMMEQVVCSQCDTVTPMIKYIVKLSEKWQAHLWDDDSSGALDE